MVVIEGRKEGKKRNGKEKKGKERETRSITWADQFGGGCAECRKGRLLFLFLFLPPHLHPSSIPWERSTQTDVN
jgi:hypothetical protein